MNAPVDMRSKCVVVYIGTRKLVVMLGDTAGGNPQVLRHEEALFPEGFEKGLVSNLQNASA